MLTINDIPVRLLKERKVEEWNTWKRAQGDQQLDMSNFDFAGKRAYGADLSGAILIGAKFRGSDLSAANFSDCVLDGVDFREAIIPRTEWCNVRCEGGNFTKADMTAADMTNAHILHTLFCQALLRGVIAENANLTGSNLLRADLTRAKFIRTVMQTCDLTGALLNKAVLSGTDLTNACILSCSALHAHKVSQVKIGAGRVINAPWDAELQESILFPE